MELEATDACRPPTPAFLMGLSLTTLHALVGLALGAALLAIDGGHLAGTQAWLEGLDWGVTNFLLRWARLMGVIYSTLFAIQLVACTTAWFGSRAGTWTVVVTSIGSAATSTYVSAPIAILTILGAMQVLDQSDPFPSDEEFYRERGRS